jgi:hypothetical protein
LRSSAPAGTRERLNSFLSKLEATWLLFNRSSQESGEGELPEESRLVLLDEADTPTPETLKRLRANLKKQESPRSRAQYLFSHSSQAKSKSARSEAKRQGPKDSPPADNTTPRAGTPPQQSESKRPHGGKSPAQPGSQPKEKAAQQRPTAGQKPAQPSSQSPTRRAPPPQPKQGGKAPGSKPAMPKPPPSRDPATPHSERSEAPRHMQRREPSEKGAGASRGQKGSVLGRKPGTSKPSTNSSKPGSKPQPQGSESQQQQTGQLLRRSSKRMAQRRSQLLGKPGVPARRPIGRPTTKSFLGTTSQAQAQLRSSDQAGRPGPATGTSVTRQAVFSQSLGQVHPKLKKRQVSSVMPVHSSVLDECHEESGGDSGPIRLNWAGGKSRTRTPAQRLFAHRRRLQLSRRGGGGSGLGNLISLKPGVAQKATAQADVSTRVAGAAIGSLLEELYEEEEVENLDEETAVTSLGLILRLGGEFTYEHSTRVLDLALELADEVGIRDKQTRKEIKYGTVLRDVGEFDLLLQSGGGQERLKEFSGFLAGQDMLRAGLLHDIGKVAIPKEILYKPGKLTEEEYELMKMHPIYGEEIVRPIASLRYLCPTIRGHHERWDGKGYPDGLSGDKIPLAARIISVADVFDALSAERPYKRGMEVRKVKMILEEGRGAHFDPFLVDAFLGIIGRRYPE